MKFKYQFSVNEDDYVNAIIKYNPEYVIKSIKEDGEKTVQDNYKKLTVRNLKSLIESAKERKVEKLKIKVVPAGFENCSILPPIDSITKFNYLNTPAQNAFQNRYFEFRMQMREVFCLDEKTALKPITQEETMNFFLSVNHREDVNIEITGALHLFAYQTILFQNQDGYCFYFTYGDKPALGIIKYFCLNIESGFEYEREEWHHSSRANFFEGLSDYFNKWKENHYKEPLFPCESYIGFNPEEKQIKEPLVSYSPTLFKIQFDGDDSEKSATKTSETKAGPV